MHSHLANFTCTAEVLVQCICYATGASWQFSICADGQSKFEKNWRSVIWKKLKEQVYFQICRIYVHTPAMSCISDEDSGQSATIHSAQRCISPSTPNYITSHPTFSSLLLRLSPLYTAYASSVVMKTINALSAPRAYLPSQSAASDRVSTSFAHAGPERSLSSSVSVLLSADFFRIVNLDDLIGLATGLHRPQQRPRLRLQLATLCLTASMLMSLLKAAVRGGENTGRTKLSATNAKVQTILICRDSSKSAVRVFEYIQEGRSRRKRWHFIQFRFIRMYWVLWDPWQRY